MTTIYSLPDCGKCDAAKQKLNIFHIQFEERPYGHYLTYHDGWREDGSLEAITARCFFGEKAVPLIEHYGIFYDYPGFMKEVKRTRASSCEKIN